MLYDEHTWGASESIHKPYALQTLGQWAIKSSFSYKAAIRTKDILRNALNNITYRIKRSNEDTIAVFNSLSWERSDIVHLNVPINYLKGNKYFQIIDVESGKNLPYQIIGEQEKSLIIGFFAQNIPALGYKIYKILPSDKLPEFKTNISVDNERIENKFYKISIDPITGGIRNILDKELKQEFVDQDSPYKVNQYIYERLKGGRGAVLEKGAKFYRSSPTSANLTSEMRGPVMASILINTRGEGCPRIIQKVILYEDIKRIDIINILSKEETLKVEGVYYAFPFKVENPSFKCEIADAIFSPGVDQLNGSASDYYSIQHWLDISNHNYGVTWATIEAPLVQLCDINTGKWLKRLEITNSTFFSYIMNNYWDTNFKASQGGDLTFRYSITTHRGSCDVVKATHFGWNYANSLVGIFLSKTKEGLLPAKFSFCQVDRPNVNVLVIKLAEDGKGYIVRLQEIKGKETSVKVTFPYFKNLKAYLTNIVEENIRTLKTQRNIVIVPLQPFSITTVRVIP
ncbi:MAG: glycosyl hydrolase-related protein, partial [Candidatus Asgardarchaeia archaeon]